MKKLLDLESKKKTINKPVTVLQSEVSFILTQSSSAQISTNLSQNTEFKKWFNEFMTMIVTLMHSSIVQFCRDQVTFHRDSLS